MRVLAICLQKGGVGKTTTTVNLGFALMRLGKRVLLVDADPQASLTEYLGLNASESKETIYELMRYRKQVEQSEVAWGHREGAVDLITSKIELSRGEVEFQGQVNNHRLLETALKKYSGYDFCLIDCPPSLGILTINALAAADRVLIPVITELLAARTVKLILDTIEEVVDSGLNPDLKVWRVLPTRHSYHKNNNREVMAALEEAFGDLLYPEAVRDTVKYTTAVKEHLDVGLVDAEQGIFWDKMAFTLLEGSKTW